MTDYLFFRIYSFYASKKDDPVFTAILFIFVCCVTVLFFLFGIINVLSDDFLSARYLEKPVFLAIYYTPLSLLLILIIYRYGRHGSRREILARYQSSAWNKKLKTWQFFMLPVCLLVITVLMLKLTH